MAIPAGLRRLVTRPPPRPVEVHRLARREMAVLVRRLVSRRIDNFEFDDRAFEISGEHPRDPALDAAFLWCWGLYDDIRRHRLDPLPPDQRRTAARLVAFLRTDLAYCWLDERGRRGVSWQGVVADALAWLVLGTKLPVIGLLAGALRLWTFYTPGLLAPRAPVEADWDLAWPFADREELTLTLGMPTYLAG